MNSFYHFKVIQLKVFFVSLHFGVFHQEMQDLFTFCVNSNCPRFQFAAFTINYLRFYTFSFLPEQTKIIFVFFLNANQLILPLYIQGQTYISRCHISAKC